MQKLTRLAAAVGLACTLMGCGSLHLYNKAADTAATSAKEDYDASKITESIKAARAILDALDTKEVEAFRVTNHAERNLKLLALVSEAGTSKQRTTDDGIVARFHKLADARLAELTGVNENPVAGSKAHDKGKIAVRDAELREKLARNHLTALQPAFSSLPACNSEVSALELSTDASKAIDLLKNADPKLKSSPIAQIFVEPIKTVGKRCSEVLTARAQLAKTAKDTGGQLRFATAELERLEGELKAQDQQAKEEGGKLKTAAAALAAAQKAGKDASIPVDLTCKTQKDAAAPAAAASAPAGGDKAVDPAADPSENELCKVIGKLRKLGDFGVKAINEERLDQLNAILGALGGAEATSSDPDLETGLAIISTTSRFAQALKQYQQVGKLPALEPLLIDKQLTAAQLAAAQAGVQLAKARVHHAREYLDATQSEVSLLVRAKAELGALGQPPKPRVDCPQKPTVLCASLRQFQEDKSLGRAPDGAGESGSRRAYRALALLSESYSVARDQQRTAELRLIDTQYREALVKSEAALASWNTLLSVPINQLQAYHLDGVTTIEAASLTAQIVQALAAVGIAVNIK
ncbi:hypothetical protein [Aquabacterium sp. CECT 9606]|uniref:hypothetical protein n=1 Tax=Aquabacterium sp. CECT 9606 TaxID=2845822 RepID=UPI001E4EEE36|nr:hypothetical protein [Aquabacterium sp. CECT 9606]CAH0353179.1 hypothetical protein AQB9606_03101 [Aquabacterium sp. CECT 9606]